MEESWVEVDIQTPESVPKPEVSSVSWVEAPRVTHVTAELSEEDFEATPNGEQKDISLYLVCVFCYVFIGILVSTS